MRRALFAVAVILTAGLAWRWRCLGHHIPVRYFLGGFKCARPGCRKVGADLEDMGFQSGWVAPLRKTYERGRKGGITRDGWVH